ncbi:gephyrin-like molybdotransferase Glp [Ignicoccus islandicus]|nr:gephyrin-like molybdotransferase Glp [Ignicoccus islandicus]
MPTERKRKVFKKLENVDVAFNKLLEKVPPKSPEPFEVDLLDSLGLYLAEDVVSNLSIPPFPRTSVDGYAVNSVSTWGASEDNPVRLKVKGRVKVGEEARIEIAPGEAVEVDTGSMLPPGADAVVPIEYVKEEGNEILVFRSVVPGENVLWPGTDVYPNELVFTEGERITSRVIAGLASIGRGKVKVRTVKVAVISTGNELVEPGKELPPGKVYDVNTYSLTTRLKEEGFEPIPLGVIPDDYEKMKRALEKAVEIADVVVTSGSTSAGPEDLVYRIVGELGEVIVHGLAFKPGKPVMLGAVKGKPVFGLAGHPDSAYFNLEKIVLPYLKLMVRAKSTSPRKVKATSGSTFTPARGRRTHVPVTLLEGNGYWAFPSSISDHAMVSYSKSDGYIVIPETRRAPVEVGEEVEVYLFGDPSYSYAFIGDVDVFVDEALRSFKEPVKFLPIGSFGGELASKTELKAVWLSPKASGKATIRIEVVTVGNEGKRIAVPHSNSFLYQFYLEYLKSKGLTPARARKELLHVGSYPTPQAICYAIKEGMAEFGFTTRASAEAYGLPYKRIGVAELKLGWKEGQDKLAEAILRSAEEAGYEVEPFG